MAQLPLTADIAKGGWLDGDIYTALVNAQTTLNEHKTLINQLRQSGLNQCLGNPGFQRVSNFDVNNANAVSYLNGGTLKTFAATTTFDTGTAKTCATTKWVAALLTVSAAGSATLTYTTSTSFDSEALAIAALPAPGATETVLGYVTIQAAGSTWTAGTDALASGTGGTPANATNYYNSINPNTAMIGAACSESFVLTKG